MTEKQADKAANREAVIFEQPIAQGYSPDDKQTFAEYAEYVLDLKSRAGKKHRTISGFRVLLPRINAAIGHMALQDIHPIHLKRFYESLEIVGIWKHQCQLRLLGCRSYAFFLSG